MKAQPLAPAWAHALRDYRAYLAHQDYAAGTARQYEGHADRLARHLAARAPGVGPWEVTEEHLLGYLAAGGTRSEVSVSTASRCLTYFYAWAELVGRISGSPAAGLSRRLLPAAVPASWREAVAGYEQWHHAKGTADTTLRVRRSHLRRLAEHCAPHGPWEVGLDVLVTFMACPEWAPETRRGMRASVATFYHWAVQAGLLDRSPAERLPTVRVPRARPRPIHEDVLLRVLAAAEPRERLMLMIAAYAGLRCGEIARLHSRDVDPGRQPNSAGRGGRQGYLHVQGKGHHERFVPLHPDLAAAIARWLDGRAGFLFPGQKDGHLSEHYVSTHMSRELPDRWTLHALRHRFASAAYAGDRDLRAVQELLGHAKPETTARYTAVPDGAMLAAVMAAGPR